MTYEIERFEHHGCRVTISLQDEDIEFANPRDGDNTGIMLANGARRYTLGDEPFMKGKGTEYDQAEQAIKYFLERMPSKVALNTAARWLRIYGGATVVLPLWLLDHSGLSMSTGRSAFDPGGWDSGIVGIIFDTPRTRAMTQGEGVEVSVEDMERYLTDEVRAYSAYLEGQVVQYTVEKKKKGACGHSGCRKHRAWEVVDSCGGYLDIDDALDYVRSEAKASAEAHGKKGKKK